MKSSVALYKETQFRETPTEKVPPDWDLVELERLTSLFQSGIWGDNPVPNRKSYPVIRSTELTHSGKIDLSTVALRRIPEEKVNKYAIEDGDILLVGSSGSSHLIGRAALFEHPHDDHTYLFSNFMVRIRPKEIDSRFLYYFLSSSTYYENLGRLQETSTGLRNLPKKEFLQIRIPFPPDIREQQGIAEILFTADRTIQKVDEIIAKTEKLKKGLMEYLLTRGIGHKEFKDTEIGRIPIEWTALKLDEALDLIQYGLSVKMADKGKYPIIRMDELENGYVVPQIEKYTDLDNRAFNHFKLEKGDILFNRTNSFELVGRPGIFLLEGDYVFASYLIRLRAKKDMIDPRYLTFYLLSSRSRLQRLATRAVHQANINATNLRNMKVPVPPISEQQKIADVLSAVDRKIEVELKEKARLETIKKSLMDSLLTGKIRVKVN